MQMFYAPSTSGFYTPHIHGDAMPADAVAVTDTLYAALMAGQESGGSIAAGPDGQPVLIPLPPPDPAQVLAEAKAQALTAINAAVAATRSTFITDLPGQEMIYLGKEAEARRWLAAPTPDLADYPFLTAEVGISAPTAQDLATLWVTLGAQWRAVAALIEGLRLTATAAVAAALTPQEAEAAASVIPAQLALIGGAR